MKYLFILVLLSIQLVLPRSVSASQYLKAPTKIIIPSLKISLPVHTAKIIFNTWEVHLDGASFGEGTTLPGNLGNTVIFSHARVGLFSDLPKIKKGDLVHVFTDKDWFVYRVEDTFIVDPDKVNVLANHDRYELTLYTCTGDNWTKRFIVRAKLLTNPSSLEN